LQADHENHRPRRIHLIMAVAVEPPADL